MIGQASLDGWRYPECLVCPAEVVISEVQCTCRFQVVQLFRESIGQSGESADRHSHREVLPFHVARGDVARIGPSVNYLNYRLYHRRRRVATGSIVLAVVTIQFYHLRKISLTGKHVLDSASVEVESVRSDLEAMIFCKSAAKIGQERIRSFDTALANHVRRDQLCFSVNTDVHPSVSRFGRVIFAHVFLFLAHERPDFVALHVRTTKVSHPCVHHVYAALPSQHKQANDRVAMQTCDSLGAANAGAFDQKLNRQQSLFFGNCHAAKQARSPFGVGLAALRAAEAGKPVALLAKLAAFEATFSASHGSKIQQARAVCQQKSYCFFREKVYDAL